MARLNKAIAYAVSIALFCSLGWFVIARRIYLTSTDIAITLESLEGAQFVQGMHGAENILVTRDGSRLYVTDLRGFTHLLKVSPSGQYAMENSRKLGRYALGLGWVNGKYDEIFVGVSANDWLHPGSSIFRVSADLREARRVTRDFPGLNGLTTDASGNVYIATGNFGFMNPKGSVIRVGLAEEDTVIAKARSGNGLTYNESDDALYYSEVFSGISKYDLCDKKNAKVVGKSKIVEGFDDFCIDVRGNFWIADPPSGFIKHYDAKRKLMTRIRIRGLGVASSCRVASRNGTEYLYVTEIRQEKSREYDGRGVLIVPVDALIASFGGGR